jgi:hypothetical protein
MEANVPVADGVLVGLNLWGTTIINSRWNAKTESISARLGGSSNVYDHVLEFLQRNHGRKLCEVMDAEIDISDVIHLVPRTPQRQVLSSFDSLRF